MGLLKGWWPVGEIMPDAYRRGLHASAAEGTIGAAVTAGCLLGLDEGQMRDAIGIAASRSSAGIRAKRGDDDETAALRRRR